MGEQLAGVFQALGVAADLGPQIMFGEVLGDLGLGHYPLHEVLPHLVPRLGLTGRLVDVALAPGVAEQPG